MQKNYTIWCRRIYKLTAWIWKRYRCCQNIAGKNLLNCDELIPKIEDNDKSSKCVTVRVQWWWHRRTDIA